MQTSGRFPTSTVAVIDVPEALPAATEIDVVPWPLSIVPPLTDHLYVGVPPESVTIRVTRPDRPALTTSGALICSAGHVVGAGVGACVSDVGVEPVAGRGGAGAIGAGPGWLGVGCCSLEACLALAEHPPSTIRSGRMTRPFTVAILC